ncbi:cytochrome b/b6 domain-containing protein [Vibrio mytili]|uniref:Cytochrome B n=1 Tax=Vibrio mytili TaxID=50718 RepID=A0A0C3I4B7_9VIBR|nr:cytochrome b/b6 domain-containing protein [Vibrio mytili]KIN09172.1 cytochrome B [Vibrio mytili]
MKTKLTHWDPVVKVTHWAVATLFLLNFFVTKAGSNIHQYIGYTLVGTVVIRLVWGCISPPPARLTSFLPSIPKAIKHLKEVIETNTDVHPGHNPAGAIMIWCMWGGLIVAGISGFMMETDRYWGEDWVEIVHNSAVNITFVCICIHIFAVVVMSKITNQSYLRNMLPKRFKR